MKRASLSLQNTFLSAKYTRTESILKMALLAGCAGYLSQRKFVSLTAVRFILCRFTSFKLKQADKTTRNKLPVITEALYGCILSITRRAGFSLLVKTG